MTSIETGEPLSPDIAARLADFGRACKAAARVVALYPAAHPTIQAALSRVAESAHRLRNDGVAVLTVLPDNVLLDGRALSRADTAVSELASLLHTHLIGELRLIADPTIEEWHTFLTLLARTPDESRADGGIARAWMAAGGRAIELRLIDYNEVLRERSSGLDSRWDHIIASYLEGDLSDLDDKTIAALFDVAEDPARFKSFTEQLVTRTSAGNLRGKKDVVLRMLQALADFAARARPDQLDRILNQIAGVVPRLTPDLVVTLITTGVPTAADQPGIDLPGEVRARLSDQTVGEFVAQSVSRDLGATARLAEAFQALVPESEKRLELLDVARREAEALPVGNQPEFPDLWKSVAELLSSYSDSPFVSDAYGRELTTARAHAIEVERVSDDPPERVSSWLATVSESEVRRLDHQVLLDLLAIESRVEVWGKVLDAAVALIEHHVLVGRIDLAQELLDRIVTVANGNSTFAEPARSGLDRLRAGAVMKHVVQFVRQATDADVPVVSALCRALGPEAVRPLVEALAVEQGPPVRRLRAILLDFGAAGRAWAHELRQSANPAVRRTAVDLLRAFGGAEALPDLVGLLDDGEPTVQRDAVRAIVQIGGEEAYATLGAALSTGSETRRELIVQALASQRDARAAPVFIHILGQTQFRRRFERVYVAAVDALGKSSGDPEAVAALKDALYRGEWSAPRRTARVRAAAAAALRTSPAPAAQQVLEEAAQEGPRGVRRAARAALSAPAPRIPPRRTN